MSKANNQKLAECHPLFADAVGSLLEAMPYKLRIVEAYRSKQRQQDLLSKGLSKTPFGYHNCTSRSMPAALAVDLVDKERGYIEHPTLYADLAVAAKKQGLMTGVLFGLPVGMKRIRQQAIDNEDPALLADLLRKTRGWDPLHVQVGRALYIKILQSGLDEDPGWPT